MIHVVKLGRVDYHKALKLQEDLLRLRQNKKINDTLLLLEHNPVITMGTTANEKNILVQHDILVQQGIDTFNINRGGDVTFHGPGQLVGYPIFNLENHGKDLHLYIYQLEEVFIRLLEEEYGIYAHREAAHRGVWVDNNKITAIGCSIKKWVSMHGFAFNVNIDLECFKLIVPCGIPDKGVTSLQRLLKKPLDMDLIIKQIVTYIGEVFHTEICFISENDLTKRIEGVCIGG